MRDTIKDSVRVAHPSMPEAEIDGLMITTHDLIKFACSTVVVLSGVWKSSCPSSWDKVILWIYTSDRCLESMLPSRFP